MTEMEKWKSIKNSFCMVIKFNKIYLPVTLIYKILQGIIPTIYIVIMQKIINMIQSKVGTFKELEMFIVVFIVVHIVSSVLLSLYTKYNNEFCLDFSKFLNIQIMNKAINLSMCDFENPDTYDIINRAQNQSGNDIVNYISTIFDVFQQIILGISMGYIIFQFRWQLSGIILIVPLGKCIVTYILDEKLYKMRIDRTSLERQKWYLSFLTMTGNAFKEIRVLGLGPFFLNKYKEIQSIIIKQEKEMYTKRTFINMILEIIEEIISGLITFYLFILAFGGRILIGDAVAYAECIDNIKDAVNGTFDGINNLAEQSMYINLLFEFLELPILQDKGYEKVEEIKCVEFNNVSFKYKDNDKLVIQNVNFKLKQGQTIALLGENGSGKTTLIKLLLGFYSEYSGKIFINGIDMNSLNKEFYQKKISIVFQDYIKYETSLRENIAYGNINIIKNDEKICELLKSVHLESKATGEDGIDTVVGNWFGVTQCSIGEWQRLAIARALSKNADIFIFDEPDASLDVFRQRELVDVMKNAMKGKIGVYVSHRIGFVNKIADIIIVLKNGEVCEIGSHECLIKKRGYYYQLYLESINKCS